MKEYFNYLLQDKLLKRLFLIAFVLLLLTVIYIAINYSKLPPLLPLFNQLPWGEKRLSGTLGIFIPSLVVLSVLIFNIFASMISYSKFPLISRMFAITSFLVSLLTFLFIVRTILLII